MKFGLLGANLAAPNGRRAIALARAAERAGFAWLWAAEHVVVPARYRSRYPYHASGRLQLADDADLPDPLLWLAHVAAATERIRLGTGVLILPLRNPLVTAKAVATLDVLSGGRAELGVGVGWLAEEFEALGMPFEERGPRTDEAIRVLRTLWT